MQMNDKQFYFVIRNKTQESIGTIRIYDIVGKEFCWGSWIVLPDHRKYASLESMFLLLKFAFFDLDLLETNFDVRKENRNVVNFHLKSGAQITNEDSKNFYFNYKKEYFLSKYNYYQKFVKKVQFKS